MLKLNSFVSAALSVGFAALTLQSTSLFADQPENGQLVPIAAETAFVPRGFDNNDEVVVVVEGYLPNSCYRLTRPEVYTDLATGTIKVIPFARYFAIACLESLVPFNFEVRVGVLPVGHYTVTVNNDRPGESLSIYASANPGPDDFLYAPIDNASVDLQDDGTYAATISGRFTNSCMAFSELRLINSGKTLELLPIISVKEGADCQHGEFHFKEKVQLPEGMTVGRHMLHVRSLNGRALNRIFSVGAL